MLASQSRFWSKLSQAAKKKTRLDQNGAKMGAKMIPLVKGATIGLFTTL